MKIVATTTAVALATLALGVGSALAQSGPEVEIQHAVARVVVIVENRTDIGVEIQQGASGLPALRVTRTGADVRIDGGLSRGRVFNRRSSIRNCHSGVEGGQPGDGASVEVRDVGRVNLSDAPLIVIRTPRTVNVEASGAVFGSIGRGATAVDLGSGSCGYWNVANTDGPVSLSIGGSGGIRAGTSSSLDISIGGSGSVTAGATRDLDVSIGGSGEVMVARIDGPADVAIAGSGDVAIRAGSSPDLSISIVGSGDVNFGGVAGDVAVSIAGGGDVTVARATGSVTRSIAGSGDIRIGS